MHEQGFGERHPIALPGARELPGVEVGPAALGVVASRAGLSEVLHSVAWQATCSSLQHA
jgi:hypothetical protein